MNSFKSAFQSLQFAFGPVGWAKIAHTKNWYTIDRKIILIYMTTQQILGKKIIKMSFGSIQVIQYVWI